MSRDLSERKALIRYRLENARRTFNDAQVLFTQGGTPKSIVNRAYYAMFYAALALLASIGQQPGKHSGVVALFDQHFVKTKIFPKEMSTFLHTALDTRQVGDYEDEAEITQNQALEILDTAAQFINSIEEKLSDQ